ncbi:hypothetical protein [Paenibacillus sp. FSL R5-0470]|uniref:hypothetical protein n=1 Tax=Paenibacillus sp. FSL R5-0470 TaxID=2921641 RepID=UPI0030DB647B
MKKGKSMLSKMNLINEVGAHVNTIDQLYKSSILNRRGKTTNGELFAEVIAEELLRLDIKNRLKEINEVVRESGYRVITHDGVVTTGHKEEDSNRKEERVAIQLFNLSQSGKIFNGIGRIMDYQVPLKNSSADKGLGKIDLISLVDDCMVLIEFKINENRETLLRCVLEIATYYQVLSKSKFLNSYSNEFGSPKRIKKAVLIVIDSLQYKEILELRNGERKHLEKLMDALEVQVFCMDPVSFEVQTL